MAYIFDRLNSDEELSIVVGIIMRAKMCLYLSLRLYMKNNKRKGVTTESRCPHETNSDMCDSLLTNQHPQ